MRRRALAWSLAALLAGCAYYNGMYNANRLARAAEKAEREGRTFDAASLWGQAGVKADTVLARHGDSKWADDALLVRGKAYQRLGDCTSAVTTFRDLLARSSEAHLVEQGTFLLGKCYQSLGQVDQATTVFARLISSQDPALRSEALYQHGHSLVLGGDYQAALEELEQSRHPRASGERAAALAGLGQTDAALVIADSLIAAGDTAAPWLLMAETLGATDPATASQLVSRIITIPGLPPERAGELLVADASRLRNRDPAAARARLQEIIARGAGTPAFAQARVLQVRLRLDQAITLDSLKAVRGEFSDVMQAGGNTGILMAQYDRAAGRVLELTDSADAGASSPDLRLFLAAEQARDSLVMPQLAAELFTRVSDEYSSSAYAPKALLARMDLDPSQADSLRSVLYNQYPASPYLLAWEGQDAPGFSSLEDSLAGFAQSLAQTRPTRNDRQPARTQPGGRLPIN